MTALTWLARCITRGWGASSTKLRGALLLGTAFGSLFAPSSAAAQTAVYIANRTSSSVSVIDLSTRAVVATIPLAFNANPRAVAVTPDGTRVYVANFLASSVSVINSASNTVVATVPVGAGPSAIAINAAGTRAYVASQTANTIGVINTSTNSLIATINSTGWGPTGLAITPNAARVYVANQTTNSVSVIDTNTNRVVATIGSTGWGPTGVAITPNGARVYVTNQTTNSVMVIDTTTNGVVATITATGWGPTGVAITPNGARAYVANQTANSIMAIDTATNKVVATIGTTGTGPTGVAVTPDGSAVYVANGGGLLDNRVTVIATSTNSIVATIAAGASPYGVAIAALAPCTYAIAPGAAAFAASASTGSMSVTTTAACAWTAKSNASWLTVTAGAAGSGNSTVRYSVTANTGAARTGTITIGDKTFTVTQAAPCVYAITPTTVAFAAVGGAGSVSVTAAAGCTWAATSTVTWAPVTSGSSGSGSGTVRYSVARNTGAARTGTLTIAGKTLTVAQASPCAYAITPTTAAFAAASEAGTVSVTTSAGCAWTATSNAAWAPIASGSSGSGSGTLRYSVTANAGVARTGTLTIAGVTFTLTQAPSALFSIMGNVDTSGVTVTAGGVSTVSDGSGNYLIANLPAGTYTVTAAKAGCAVSPPLLASVGPSATGVNFTVSCGPPVWQISNIGMPAGVYVNAVWARSRTDGFVAGSRSVLKNSTSEGYLYHWNGARWTESLYLPNATMTSVTGTGTSEVWVAAYLSTAGPSVLYGSTDDGASWTPQTLPLQIGSAWVGSLTGTPNNVQASAGGNTIVRFDGAHWTALPAGGTTNNDQPGPMTMLGANEGYYTTCWGWGSWDGTAWTFHANGFDFCDVDSLWGTRDTSHNLQLFTAGNNNFSNGVRVWKLQGSTFGSKCGYIFGDPINGTFDCNGIFAGNGSYGYATGIWGSSANDLYVTGKLGYPVGYGKIYHFDGVSWQDFTGTFTTLAGGALPVATGIFGTAADDIWVPLADGRILRYTR